MSIYDTHKPKSNGGTYLKLNDGDTVRLRIASEPVIFESISDRDGKETVTTRYAWKVWNQIDATAQILQQSATFFRTIASLAQDEEWGDPTGYDIKITRSGANFNDTTYTVNPSPNREPLSAEALQALEGLDTITMIEASPFSQHVFWLSDFEKGTSTIAPKAKAQPSKEVAKEDVTIQDMQREMGTLNDDPVNLDDIPF
jgi:hypothetical protein